MGCFFDGRDLIANLANFAPKDLSWWGNVALNLVALIPLIGVLKPIIKGFKHLDEAAGVVKYSDEVADSAKYLDEGAEAGKHLDEVVETVEAARKTQKAIIESVENSVEGTKGLTSLQKGNYGEMKMDNFFESQGYDRISTDRVTDLDTLTHQGIDGVYYNPDGHPPYIIGEAKYGSAKLDITKDGKQMSDTWINGSDRLVNSVGKEFADDILLEGYEKKLVNILPDGTVNIIELD